MKTETVKNEEKSLKKCLSKVAPFVDEIIIADTGSKDNTKDIALEFTDKIYDFKWCNDFSKARNYYTTDVQTDLTCLRISMACVRISP